MSNLVTGLFVTLSVEVYYSLNFNRTNQNNSPKKKIKNKNFVLENKNKSSVLNRSKEASELVT